MPFAVILPTVAAYVVVALLLLSLNLTSRWVWWIKAGAIGITTAFFAGSYLAVTSLFGWPTREALPARFQLLWSKVIEPDQHSKDPGAIYLWVETLDERNLPIGRPRAYELPWSADLARKVGGAQDKRQRGEEVAGKAEKIEEGDEPADQKVMSAPMPDRGQQSSATDTVPFADPDQRLSFENLPPPVMPDKAP